MMDSMVGGIDVSENGLALDALREVGPGQHFLGAGHTQENFETAFWRSSMADNTTFEQWESEGCIEAEARARKKAIDMLAGYEAPAIDPAIDEELIVLINKRKSSLPDSEY